MFFGGSANSSLNRIMKNHISYFGNAVTIQNNPSVVERLIAQAIANAN